MSTIQNSRYFSETYEESRSRFIKLTANASITKAVPITEEHNKGHQKGMNGEPLYIDFAVFGNIKNPENILIYTCGAHGIEGFVGAAIQLKIIEDYFNNNQILSQLPKTAILFIHTLNPYGMSFIRRANKNNVDLNRNFFYEEFKGQIEEKKKKTSYEQRGTDVRYGYLNDLLNPSFDEIGYFDNISFYFSGLHKFMTYGYTSFKQSIFEGQYAFPKGLFYGGDKLEKEPEIVFEFLTDFLTKTIDKKVLKKVIHIDIHSGMGDYAEDLLVVDRDKNNEFLQLFGSKVYPVIREHGEVYSQKEFSAYTTKGSVISAFREIFERIGVSYYGICQEFGTYGTIKCLKALRLENAAFSKYGEKLGKNHPSKKELLEAFYPHSCLYWKTKVLKNGQEFVNKCLSFIEKNESK